MILGQKGLRGGAGGGGWGRRVAGRGGCTGNTPSSGLLCYGRRLGGPPMYELLLRLTLKRADLRCLREFFVLPHHGLLSGKSLLFEYAEHRRPPVDHHHGPLWLEGFSYSAGHE